MEMKKMKYILPLLLVVVAMIAPLFWDVLLAQPSSGPPLGGATGNEPPCFDPPCIPIDGGLGFLVAAGVALGGKKIYDATSKKK